jgi:hypothetical protein
MIALVRFRPYILVGGWLLALLVLIDGALRLLDNTPVFSWLPKVTSGSGFKEDNRQRVEGAQQEYEEGRVGPGEYLCAIIGLSNVREAVPLKVVSDEAGLPCRYLGLGAAGLGMPDLGGQARLLLESKLRPDLVLLGIGPHQLVDTRPKPGAVQDSFLDSMRRGDFRNAAIAIRNSFWFFARRLDVSITLDKSLLDARAAMFRSFGVQLQESGTDHRSPWREMIRAIFVEHFSEATLREEEQFFQGLGVFDRETYTNSPKAKAILVQLIQDFRARGSVVVVILMPENSRLRKRMPPNIIDAVTTPLQKAFEMDVPPVLDLRDKIDDAGFVDLTHLNPRGSAECGRLIGAKIRDYLPHNALHRQREGNAR